MRRMFARMLVGWLTTWASTPARQWMRRMFARMLVGWAALVLYSPQLSAEPAPGSAKPQETPLVLTADTPWVVSTDEPEPMRRALADVKVDWYKVLGRTPVVLSRPPEDWKGPLVYLGLKGDWRADLVPHMDSRPETFLLTVQPDGAGRPALLATGADLRGSIYAAYALSEEVLGVDPWYYWVDKEPAFRGRIELPVGFSRPFGPPTFRYRGWFINDEDLLGGYAPDPLRENVFSLEMWDRICETLLRLRGNMLVPGTFTFPDERCQELASRRGLILNMHHILVVGLNTFRWPASVPFSYSRHPQIMEDYWQKCIEAFKDREVVWTVGYRGKHDRPFWADEPGVTTPEARGALISKAIAKQVELIRKAHPAAPIISNLWVEGAELYRAGHLRLPPGVTVVWPDDGTGIIQDHGQVKAGQGIYYHTAMLNGHSNQLSEMVGPARITSEIGRFVRAGATEFFLVNVSDIRPVPLTTDCAMKMVWQAGPFLERSPAENNKAFLADWSRRQFGAQAAPRIAEIYEQYFDIPYHRDDVRQGENAIHFALRQINVKAAPLIAKGQPLDEALVRLAKEKEVFASSNLRIVAPLAARAQSLAEAVPVDRRAFYLAHVVTPLQVHRCSLAILESYAQSVQAYAAGEKPRALELADQALQISEELSAALRRAEYGKWPCWYMGERFVGLNTTYERLRCLKAYLTGQPQPPIRASEGYPELYQYQEPFSADFPLLYPPDK
jgi:hypothetical protein